MKDNLTIQTFDDSGQNSSLAQIFQYDEKRIKELSKRGAGIFWCINPQIDTNKRGIENTKEMLRFALDLDVCKDGKLNNKDREDRKRTLYKKLQGLKIKPTYTIVTKNGLQPVWEFKETRKFEDPQKANLDYQGLVKGFEKKTGLVSEGDSISRVIRLEGTLHQKDPKDKYKIKSVGKTKPVNFKDFIKEYPPAIETSNFDTSLLSGVDKGSRALSAASVIGKLIRNLKPSEFEVIWPLVVSWNSQNNPPLKERELRRTFDSICKKEQNNGINSVPGKLSGDNFTPLREGGVLSSVPRLISELSTDNHKVDWIWEGYIAKGHTTLFSALWKSGKSTLLAHLLKHIKEGKPLAGQRVSKSKVLIVSEESEGIWARRKEDFELEKEDIWLLCNPINRRLNYNNWVNFLETQAQFCIDNEIDLFVIDTLAGFWNVANENDASMVGSALLPLRNFRKNNIAVLLIHHHRKSGGDYGEAARGSGALSSYVDTIMDFMRVEGNPDSTQRLIKSVGRYEETPTDIVIEYNNGKYITMGNRFEVSKATKKIKLLQILKDSNSTLTSAEIFYSWEKEQYGTRPNIRTVRRYIDQLLEDGRLVNANQRIVGKTKVQTYALSRDNGPSSLNNVRQDRPPIRENTKKSKVLDNLNFEEMEEI